MSGMGVSGGTEIERLEAEELEARRACQRDASMDPERMTPAEKIDFHIGAAERKVRWEAASQALFFARRNAKAVEP